jgi:tripartite-type tricarboxylate transporter receptor subunit TctC
METTMRSVLQALVAGVCVLQVNSAAAQQAYPEKDITVLVGVPPGGSSDAVARIFAASLQEQLGRTTIVENRPGANTLVAANAVANAPADGYTLLVASDAFITVPLLNDEAYDPFEDFAPIGTLTESPFVVVVHPSTPIQSMSELVAYAKEHPGELLYGSSGNGGASHLGGEKLKMMTETEIVHIPYRGAGPALIDALSGQYQMSLWTPFTAGPHIKEGKLRALAVTGPERLGALPDVPTSAEAGLPEYQHRTWIGVFAPADTPKEIVDKIAAVIAEMQASPAIREQLEMNGLNPYPSTPEQFTEMMRAETEEVSTLIDAASITLD